MIDSALFLALFLSATTQADLCNRTSDELLRWLETGYDNRVRPNATGDPVVIDVETYVSSIGSVNEQNMEFSVDMFFRQRWMEARLCYLPRPSKGPNQRLVLTSQLLDKVWKPDIYFKNSKIARFHNVPTANVLYGITPCGGILLSARVTTKLSCHMNFRRFPMDVQHCHFQIGSYANTEDDVIVQWRNGIGLIISDEVEIPQYSITRIMSNNSKGVYNTGVFSEPKATMVFERRLMYYVYGYYLPASLVCFLSWISFWIDPRSVPARVSLGVITILAMGSFLHSGGGPNVSYATALDVYIFSCYMFVFASLMEYAIVHCGLNYCGKIEMQKNTISLLAQDSTRCSGLNVASSLPVAVEKYEHKSTTVEKMNRMKDSYFRFNAMSLENYARVAFPLIFGFFNLVYWMILYQI